MPRLRLLPFASADGATNMAADEALLISAAAGQASLRFYAWSPATLSLGYFQPAAARLTDPRLAALPWVRRASGGATLVHDRELTYALALPAGSPWQSSQLWMLRFHQIVRDALSSLGVETNVVAAEELRGDVLCFQKQTVGDLVCRGQKIGGSAQRKQRRALLQHGSILLRQSPATPALPGLFELTAIDVAAQTLQDEIVRQLAAATAWSIELDAWSAAERATTTELARDKFGHPSWNEKR